jgi:hypothetical protein
MPNSGRGYCKKSAPRPQTRNWRGFAPHRGRRPGRLQCPGCAVADSSEQRRICACWSGHQPELADVQSLHDYGPSGHNNHLA